MNAIRYTDDVSSISTEALTGFFVGWPSPPSPETHLAILQGSYRVWLALEDDRCVGFITAISDGVLAAFIPLLEVLPTHQGQGIGTELVSRMTDSLSKMYSVDVVCDDDVVPFYERHGLQRGTAMLRRNYEQQSGRSS